MFKLFEIFISCFIITFQPDGQTLGYHSFPYKNDHNELPSTNMKILSHFSRNIFHEETKLKNNENLVMSGLSIEIALYMVSTQNYKI